MAELNGAGAGCAVDTIVGCTHDTDQCHDALRHVELGYVALMCHVRRERLGAIYRQRGRSGLGCGRFGRAELGVVVLRCAEF